MRPIRRQAPLRPSTGQRSDTRPSAGRRTGGVQEVDVIVAPRLNAREHRRELPPDLRQAVLHARRHLRIDRAAHDSLALERLELRHDSWGIDHGAWSILVHIFPEADIPVVQLSVNGDITERAAYDLGQRLASLREKGYLIMGSGNVVHNLRRVEWENEHGSLAADRFDEAIKAAIEQRDDEAVIDYHRYPAADYAVPTPDHFLPLLYILGASQGESPYIFNNVRNLGSMALTGYAFGL